MASAPTVQIAGMRELRAALRLLYPELEKELRAGLSEIVKQIENAARSNADIQGFTPPGRSGRGVGNLIGQIRSGVTVHKGYVKDTANRDGYYYPARYEYESGGARAFLRPAVEQNRDKIEASILAIVENTIRMFNEGGI